MDSDSQHECPGNPDLVAAHHSPTDRQLPCHPSRSARCRAPHRQRRIPEQSTRFERHRKKVAVWAAVKFVAVGFEISEKNRPERVVASTDQWSRETLSEYAIALVLDLGDLVASI